jgi:hypothetical protein
LEGKAKSPTSKKKTGGEKAAAKALENIEDSRKAKEDAKLKAMADLSSISEEFANIVTKL